MDSTGGGAIHGRVFVTTVYDATGKQGAGLFIGVSLLPQCTTRQALRGRGYSWACLCDVTARRNRQAGGGAIHGRLRMDSTGGGAIHWRVFVTTVYARDRQAEGGPYSWACLHMDSTGDGAIHWRVFVTTVYDTTGTEGAWLFISVSLLLQCYYSVRRDRQAGGGLIHGRLRRDNTGGGAVHWRVFVTTVYDTTGIEGAGLLIDVSLLLQCATRQAHRGRGYSYTCLCYHSIRRDRHTGDGAIHIRVFVTTVYDATGKQGAGLFIGVSLLPQCTTRQASRGRGYS